MTFEPLLQAAGIAKSFGGVRALAGVDVSFLPGEIHGIVGENGAGKSTLMKILSGVETPSQGSLHFRSQPVALRNPLDAQRLGIVMIHQELNLVDELTVAENIFLGRELTRFGLVDRAGMCRRAESYLRSIGSTVDPSDRVATLSIADKQLVEIAKALSYDAAVIIMDEPTAVLTSREAQALFRLIHDLKSRGVTVIYISHHLDEVLGICDRITVMRDGNVVARLDETRVKQTSEKELAGLMVGRAMAEHFPPRRAHAGDVVIEIANLTVPGRVHDVSFQVHRGEIFGLAGLIGAGRTETAEGIAGIRRRSTGEIRIDGREVHITGPADAVRHGIAYLSEDRKGTGLTLDMSIVANETMVSLKRYCRLLVNRKAEQAAAAEHVRRLRIKIGHLSDKVSTLSGGNQQKVLLAKWLETRPRVLIVDEPTRGVDIGAKEEIYRLLQELADEGMACIMISSEINELLGMCHRIGVMHNGRLVTILDAQEATEERVMYHAAGVEADSAAPALGGVAGT